MLAFICFSSPLLSVPILFPLFRSFSIPVYSGFDSILFAIAIATSSVCCHDHLLDWTVRSSAVFHWVLCLFWASPLLAIQLERCLIDIASHSSSLFCLGGSANSWIYVYIWLYGSLCMLGYSFPPLDFMVLLFCLIISVFFVLSSVSCPPLSVHSLLFLFSWTSLCLSLSQFPCIGFLLHYRNLLAVSSFSCIDSLQLSALFFISSS